ncbi:MAG TPA: hypothetical protein VFE24_02910 [Pirellulales bacterium]|nr:hypothetical protein [Pirellulales bacterium]
MHSLPPAVQIGAPRALVFPGPVTLPTSGTTNAISIDAEHGILGNDTNRKSSDPPLAATSWGASLVARDSANFPTSPNVGLSVRVADVLMYTTIVMVGAQQVVVYTRKQVVREEDVRLTILGIVSKKPYRRNGPPGKR